MGGSGLDGGIALARGRAVCGGRLIGDAVEVGREGGGADRSVVGMGSGWRSVRVGHTDRKDERKG